MATTYDNTNRGSIWKNDKKETDTHPDFTGSVNVDGKDFWVSAWKRKEGAKEGSPALSFTVKAKDAQGAKPTQPSEKKGSFDDFEDDIPF